HLVERPPHLTRTRSTTAGGSERSLQWRCCHKVNEQYTCQRFSNCLEFKDRQGWCCSGRSGVFALWRSKRVRVVCQRHAIVDKMCARLGPGGRRPGRRMPLRSCAGWCLCCE